TEAEFKNRILNETFIKTVDYHHEITSTNDRAQGLIQVGEVFSPALIFAERQTAGRGRGTNRWLAGDGSLTFSVILNSDESSIDNEQISILPLILAGLVLSSFIPPSSDVWHSLNLIVLSLWALGTGFGAWAGWMYGIKARGKQFAYGYDRSLCRRCGYSLRGLQGTECPECGLVIRPAQHRHLTKAVDKIDV
ncbi:MAG: hypothetical protein AAGA25_08940, partial [Planctomycetota bacterium]